MNDLATIHTNLNKIENNWEHCVKLESENCIIKCSRILPSARTKNWITGLKFDAKKQLSFVYSLKESTVIWDKLVVKGFKVTRQEIKS